MGWHAGYRGFYPTIEFDPRGRFRGSLGDLQVIDRCFIRKDHDCGKIKGASKSCFVACPKEDELEPILELMSEKLAKVGIEAIIAVKERAYGQDIFCTKICGKIIESKFCIVILDDEIDNGKNIPNPNVYYEYGLMTSLEKHIIPLQKENLKLAFNIQSYDTIKYNSSNIGKELDRAIRDAIKITEEGAEPKQADFISQKNILRSFELAGFGPKDDDWFLNNVINDTDFRGFSHDEREFYIYLGKVDEEDELQSYLEDINIVFYRTEKQYQELDIKIGDFKQDLEAIGARDKSSTLYNIQRRRSKQIVREIEEWTKAKQQMSRMYIALMINPAINRTYFMREAKKLFSQQERFELVVDKDNTIQFDSVKVKLSVISK